MARANDIIVEGSVYIDPLAADGSATGYLAPAEIGRLEIEETTELKERISKGRDTYGQVKRTVSIKNPAKLRLTLREIDPDNLAIALLGTAATYTVTAGEVTGVSPSTVTLIPGRWVQLPHANITPHDTGSEITCEVSGGASVALSDLEFNHRLGLVKYIGSTLSEATACDFTYFYGAVAAKKIQGSTQPTVRLKILLDGKNLVSGENVRVEVDEATVTPSSPVDFMSDDWLELELEGTMRTLDGASEPYRVIWDDA